MIKTKKFDVGCKKCAKDFNLGIFKVEEHEGLSIKAMKNGIIFICLRCGEEEYIGE